LPNQRSDRYSGVTERTLVLFPRNLVDIRSIVGCLGGAAVKLLRVGQPGSERPAALDAAGSLVDLSGVVPDITGATLATELDRIRTAIEGGELPVLAVEGLRVGAPLANPGKIICIGLNYRDHAGETGATLPTEPVMFMKAPDTVVGPYDDVLIPRGS